ncbi:MAG: restriction endonuclease subunit S [Chitinophagaceae bacterium]|nr:restriction endonuclease subunit S [Chitinophagaceae bacterium]
MIATALLYKETEFNWMPVIPEHWETKRAKAIFQERSIKGFPDDPLLAASQKQGVVLKEMLEQRSMEAVQNFESFKLVEKDDFVISLRSFEGGIELAYYRGIISPVYSIFYFRENKHNRDFFKYLYKSRMFIQELNVYKKGIRDGQSISYSEFANIYLPVPPKEEQDEIVQYLKAQEEKINLFIQKKQRFIELLKEQRLSIVNNYVTSENKNWIWLRLKDIVTVNDEALTEKTEDDFLIRYIDIGNVNSYGDIAEIQEYEFKDAPSRARRIVRKGDVIISTVRTYLKAITLIESDEDNLIASTGFAVLRPKENVLSEYLNFALRAEYFISSVIQNSYGVSYPAINSSTLSSLKIVIPKSTSEQQEIINKIKSETATIDTAIAKAEREIELIREYKEAMIAEAVMGKRKINFAH